MPSGLVAPIHMNQCIRPPLQRPLNIATVDSWPLENFGTVKTMPMRPPRSKPHQCEVDFQAILNPPKFGSRSRSMVLHHLLFQQQWRFNVLRDEEAKRFEAIQLPYFYILRWSCRRRDETCCPCEHSSSFRRWARGPRRCKFLRASRLAHTCPSLGHLPFQSSQLRKIENRTIHTTRSVSMR